MSVFAAGTGDENGAGVVALFGDAVRGARGTGLAGEGKIVGGLRGAGG